jgi:hypothetical protein
LIVASQPSLAQSADAPPQRTALAERMRVASARFDAQDFEGALRA